MKLSKSWWKQYTFINCETRATIFLKWQLSLMCRCSTCMSWSVEFSSCTNSLIRSEDESNYWFSGAKDETFENCNATCKESDLSKWTNLTSNAYECDNPEEHIYSWPARARDILAARIALAVSPEPRALPTRAHAATWTPTGNYGVTVLKKSLNKSPKSETFFLMEEATTWCSYLQSVHSTM